MAQVIAREASLKRSLYETALQGPHSKRALLLREQYEAEPQHGQLSPGAHVGEEGLARVRRAAVCDGAARLTALQLRRTAASKSCGVCGRGLGSVAELEMCLVQLAMRAAELSSRSREAVAELDPCALYTSRLYERYCKLSFVASLKRLKLAVITKRRCPACRCSFTTADLGRALSFIDRQLETATSPSRFAAPNTAV